MSAQKWRNPYASKTSSPYRAKRKTQKRQAPKNPAPVQQETPAPMNLKNVKTMSYKLRDEIHTISNRINDLGETMNQVCQICDMLDSFSNRIDSGSLQPNMLKNLRKVDVKQMMQLLQSPLVQALLSGELEEDEQKEKEVTS